MSNAEERYVKISILTLSAYEDFHNGVGQWSVYEFLRKQELIAYRIYAEEEREFLDKRLRFFVKEGGNGEILDQGWFLDFPDDDSDGIWVGADSENYK